MWLKSQILASVFNLQAGAAVAVQQLVGSSMQQVAKEKSGEGAPVIAMHVRWGDACMRWAVRGDARDGDVRGRSFGRPCYDFRAYMAAAQRARDRYGSEVILLATDSPIVVRRAMKKEWKKAGWRFIFMSESAVNRTAVGGTPNANMGKLENANDLLFLEERAQRADAGAGAELDRGLVMHSALADLTLLREGDIFIGTASSQFSRAAFHLIHARLGMVPPYSFLDRAPCFHSTLNGRSEDTGDNSHNEICGANIW